MCVVVGYVETDMARSRPEAVPGLPGGTWLLSLRPGPRPPWRVGPFSSATENLRWGGLSRRPKEKRQRSVWKGAVKETWGMGRTGDTGTPGGRAVALEE